MTASVRPSAVPETALPVRDVAARCGVSERTVRRWVTRDGLSAVKVGHTFWITVRDLEQFRQVDDRGQGLSASAPPPPVRLADIGTRGQRDSEAPHLADLVRTLTADNQRLSEEVGRLRAELAQRPSLLAGPTPAEVEDLRRRLDFSEHAQAELRRLLAAALQQRALAAGLTAVQNPGPDPESGTPWWTRLLWWRR